MAHHHDHHHEGDSYYIDQLCLVGLSASFAGICLSMSFWQQAMLGRILAPQFHPFVLASGVTLTALVLIRAAVLWQAAGQPTMVTSRFSHPSDQEHDHPHHHHHEDQGAHEQEHGEHARPHHDHHHPYHDHCHPEHSGHDQRHHHHPACGDHDHGWAPWRYVVVLVPVMLFLLGLPSSGPKVTHKDMLDLTEEAKQYAGLVALGPQPLQAAWFQVFGFSDMPQEEPKGIDFKTLEAAAYTAADREYWEGKYVQVLGQFSPNPRSDRLFNLARYRIQCCAADAIQVSVPMISREPVTGYAPNDWVKVTGRVEFRERGGQFLTVVQIAGPRSIVPSDPDPRPYIQ